ncbi:MAG: site-2 protease family protein [Alphaproteobacteria bacterium]|nr:site-2 protease family protein [Alphaproteobacteria bacterium]
MTLTTFRGIPIRLHTSFLVLAGGYIFFQALSGGLDAGLSAALMGLMLFGSVALHELGHAMAARRFGIRTRSITLYPFGGIAALERSEQSPTEELVIAAAGPAVNLALAAAAAPLWMSGSWLAGVFAGLNLAMALFNLLPAFPMDGGRVLRAALTKRMGYISATDTALKVGRAFAWVMLIGGLLSGNFSLLMVGGFMLMATRTERARLAWQVREGRVPLGRPGNRHMRLRWETPPSEVLSARHWDHPAF